jgi:hypothetical protein
MCFVRISKQTATFALLNIKRLVFVTEMESVYSAVRTEYIKQMSFVFKGLINYLHWRDLVQVLLKIPYLLPKYVV